MEVHAHSHTARKKWTHYFWEFLMLFLAVFCGFLAENQREQFVEHHRLTRFARQLLSGLERDTAMQNQILTELEEKEKCFDSLLYFLAMPKDDNAKWTGIYRNVHYLENPFRYTYQKAVFDQIKNSGSLRLFTNSNIVDSLLDFEYNGYLIEKQTDAEIIFISESIIPFFSLHFDKSLILQRFETYIKKPGWDSRSIGRTLPNGFLRHVAAWKNVFENLVITAREKHELPYINIIEQRVRAVVLISSIKKEYHLK